MTILHVPKDLVCSAGAHTAAQHEKYELGQTEFSLDGKRPSQISSMNG